MANTELQISILGAARLGLSPLCGALLAACAPAPALPVAMVDVALPAPTAAPAPTAQAPTVRPDPPPPDPCDELARAHQRALAGTPLESITRTSGSDPPLMPPSFGKCLPTPHGRWAAVVTAVGKDPPADVACWALVHVDAGGRTARAFPPPRNGGDATRCAPTFQGANLVYGRWSSVRFADPVLVDLDGDGEPEIYVQRTGNHQNSDVMGTDQIWTYRDGAVVSYPGARGLGVKELRDVDGDGRLDIVTHGRLRADGGFLCGLQSMATFTVSGPELLAHGQPDGGFSLDDDAARTFAKKQCPRRPPRIGGAKRSIGLDIGCALLWGATEREITRNLASCAPRPGEKIEPFCPAWCEQDKEFVAAFTAAPPPLRLDAR